MPTKIQSYRDLIAWQKAMDLVELVYRVTTGFPPAERFGLTAQMRKAAVSVASNIAEGTRHGLPGYISRVVIALGEHAELETQAHVAERLGYLTPTTLDTFNKLSTEVGELTHGLRRALQARLEREREGRLQIPRPESPRIPNPESRIPKGLGKGISDA